MDGWMSWSNYTLFTQQPMTNSQNETETALFSPRDKQYVQYSVQIKTVPNGSVYFFSLDSKKKKRKEKIIRRKHQA